MKHSIKNFTLSAFTFTLPIMISSLADPMRFKFGAVFIGAFITIVPAIILLFIFSRYIFKKIN